MKFFDCAICSKRVTSASALRSHSKVHTGERPFGCGECGRRFAHNYDLKCHFRIHTDERPYGCEICGQHFKQSTTRNSHFKVHIPGAAIRCNVCGLVFKNAPDILEHRKTHGEAVMTPPPPVASDHYQHSCCHCGKRFKLASSMKLHVRQHAAMPELVAFACELCGEGDMSLRSLMKHVKVAHLM